MFMQQAHKTYAGTSTVCTGWRAVSPGRVVHEMTRPEALIERDGPDRAPGGRDRDRDRVEIGRGGHFVRRATLGRTARRILEGYVFVPDPPGPGDHMGPVGPSHSEGPNAAERAWPHRSDAAEEPHDHGADGHQLRHDRRVRDRSGQAVLRGARQRRRGDDRHRGDEHLARRA